MSKQQTLDKWLPPKPRNRKRRAVIYDFDGTIFNSPDREAGELAYFEATSQTFPFSGWWGRMESLMPPVVPEKPGPEWLIEATVAAYRQDAKDEDAELFLMTGRPYKNRRRVIEILDHFDMKFHAYRFRGEPGSHGSNTLEIKARMIQTDIIHDGLAVLEIWEDRPEHTSEFFNLAKRWKAAYRGHLEKIVIHDVLKGENVEV